jgi:ADP-ribose pyrophosphatase
MEKIERIKENIVYKNRFATIYDDDVVFPSGVEGKYIRFEWNIPYGVVVVVSNTEGKMLLIKQYNYRKSRWEWSVPAGMGIYGVEPEKQAMNELREETGYSLNKLNFLFSLREVIETENGVYFYEGYINKEKQDRLTLDDGEAIQDVRFFDKEDVMKMIFSGEIDCYHTTVAVMYLLSKKEIL